MKIPTLTIPPEVESGMHALALSVLGRNCTPDFYERALLTPIREWHRQGWEAGYRSGMSMARRMSKAQAARKRGKM